MSNVRIPQRYLILPLLGTALSLVSAISASWWLAAIAAFLLALIFTGGENLLRRFVFGRLGERVTTWWFVQVVGEAVLYLVALLVLKATFSIEILNALITYATVLGTWIALSGSQIKTLLLLLAQSAAMRK